VTPAKRGRDNKPKAADDIQELIPAEYRASMNWAQRLKHIFRIDIETSRASGCVMKVIVCIESPVLIKQILDHLKRKGETCEAKVLPESRVSPAEKHSGCLTDEPKSQRFSFNIALTAPRQGFVETDGASGADCGEKWAGFLRTWLHASRIQRGLHS